MISNPGLESCVASALPGRYGCHSLRGAFDVLHFAEQQYLGITALVLIIKLNIFGILSSYKSVGHSYKHVNFPTDVMWAVSAKSKSLLGTCQ